MNENLEEVAEERTTPEQAERDRATLAVLDLIRLTQERKILWRQVSPSTVVERDLEINSASGVFEATVGGNRLQLYKFIRVMSTLESSFSAAMRSAIGLPKPGRNSQYGVVRLDILGPHDSVLETFPDVPSLSNLLVAARRQVAAGVAGSALDRLSQATKDLLEAPSPDA